MHSHALDCSKKLFCDRCKRHYSLHRLAIHGENCRVPTRGESERFFICLHIILLLIVIAEYSLALEQLIGNDRHEEARLKTLVKQANAIKTTATDSRIFGAYIWRFLNNESMAESALQKLARCRYVGKGTSQRRCSHMQFADKAKDLLEKHGVEVCISRFPAFFSFSDV